MIENGLVQYHEQLTSILFKLEIKETLNKLPSKFDVKSKKYNDIPFDAIKTGPLLLLLIGLSIACLAFAIELIVFFAKY